DAAAASVLARHGALPRCAPPHGSRAVARRSPPIALPALPRVNRAARPPSRTVFHGGARPDAPPWDRFIHLGNSRREWNFGRAPGYAARFPPLSALRRVNARHLRGGVAHFLVARTRFLTSFARLADRRSGQNPLRTRARALASMRDAP